MPRGDAIEEPITRAQFHGDLARASAFQRVAELEAEIVRLRKQVVHWKANHDSQLARKRRVSELYERLLRDSRKGKADWIWDSEIQGHVPCCSVQTRGEKSWERCGNGPLEGDQILTGDCGEH